MTRKRAKAKTRFYRCKRCRSPVPLMYRVCGNCGHIHRESPADTFIRKAKAMFPGSYEL